MIPTEVMKLLVEMNINAERTGTCQITDKTTVLARIRPFRTNETSTADTNADPSHTLGEQGFVNTIFKHRLRRCEEITNSPTAPARNNSIPLSSEKMPCRLLKLSTPDSEKMAGNALRLVSRTHKIANAKSRRLRR